MHDLDACTETFLSVVGSLLNPNNGAEPREELVVFTEAMGGPIVLGSNTAQKSWQGIRRMLGQIASKALVLADGPNKLDEALDFDLHRHGATEQQRKEMMIYKKALKALAQTKTEGEYNYRKASEIIGYDLLKYDKLKNHFEENHEFAVAIASLAPHVVLDSLYGDRVTLLNPENSGPLTASMLKKGCDIMTSDEQTKQMFRDVAFDQDEFLRFGTSAFLLPSNQEKIGFFKEDLDRRSALWAENMCQVIESEEVFFQGLNQSDVTIVLFGGSNHMPHVNKHLGEEASILTLRHRQDNTQD